MTTQARRLALHTTLTFDDDHALDGHVALTRMTKPIKAMPELSKFPRIPPKVRRSVPVDARRRTRQLKAAYRTQQRDCQEEVFHSKQKLTRDVHAIHQHFAQVRTVGAGVSEYSSYLVNVHKEAENTDNLSAA